MRFVLAPFGIYDLNRSVPFGGLRGGSLRPRGRAGLWDLVGRRRPHGRWAVLFGSRIVLKDFRNRAGDAVYGKATLLLRRGKSFTCAVSLGLLALGNALLVVAMNPPAAILVLIEGSFVAIGTRLYALWTARGPRQEQLAIGLGARMGNGLLILLSGWLGLSGAGAPEADQVLFAVTLTIVFAISFAYLAARPERAVVGYKG